MKQVDETSQPQETSFQYALPAVSRLAVLVSVLASGVLYALLPEHLTIGPSWLLLAIELVIMLPITVMWLLRRPLPYHLTRKLIIVVLGLITVALIVGVALFIITLPQRDQAQASGLLRTAGLLYVFNILLFGLWYWELDGGGPRERHLAGHLAADFMFPQQVGGDPGNWKPHLLDYLFVAFTTATAFSPTDTYPLTRLAKGLMVLESVVALVIVVLLIGRGVNIL
jgi:hypothetical protein